MAPSPFARRTVLGALLAGAVMGCTRSGTDTPASDKPAEPAPEPSATMPPGGRLVSMHVSGGYAGVDRRITVRPDGSCTAEVRGNAASGRLPGSEVSRLRELLEAAHFERLPSRMTDPDTYDLFQYRVTYGGRTVHTDLTRETPSLEKAIGILERTIDDLAERSETPEA